MQLSRRSALRLGASTALATSVTLAHASGAAASVTPGSPSLASPGLLRSRPQLTHGVASGDIRGDGALVWARSDRPARMVVETAATESFQNAKVFRSNSLLTPDTDGTGRLRVVGLEPGQEIFYRITLEEADTGVCSDPVIGTFRTAPNRASNIRLHWSGDVAGQGWGINDEIGGYTGFSTMLERNPDLFIHSGDTCYADGPLEESVTLSDGTVWRNHVTPAKSKVAETLEDYRGQYSYNLMDKNYLAFNAQVPQLVQWDDHETVNNWYPNEVLDDDRYTERDVNTLAERAYQAFHEWQPLDQQMAVDGRVYRKVSYGPLLDIFILDMRSYKGENTSNNPRSTTEEPILGEKQTNWLIDSLKDSRATWKIVANDLPLGIIVPDGDDGDQESVSNGATGAPAGRECEIARLLSAIKDVSNIVWLTADVHYTAAHHYSPERAQFTDFAPFWEFVSGPLHAGAFGPNEMDPTFGPKVEYVHAPGKDNANADPTQDFQHFGEVDIDGDSREMTVRLLTTRGTELWSTTLKPQA